MTTYTEHALWEHYAMDQEKLPAEYFVEVFDYFSKCNAEYLHYSEKMKCRIEFVCVRKKNHTGPHECIVEEKSAGVWYSQS